MLRQIFLALLSTVLVLGSFQDLFAAKKVAFLVGINKYKKPGFRNLNYAENDVAAMAKELKKYGFDVTLVTGKNATKSNLEGAIQKLVAPLSKEDLMLVMLAGHGVQENGGDAYYCPYDAIIDSNQTLFSISNLLNKTLAPNVGTKMLLLDACRNDPDPGRGRSVGIQGKVIALPEDTVVMFSCRSGQQSFENDEIKHGIFTYCLLDGLRGGASRDGIISWSDLQSYVNRKMAVDMAKFIPKGRRQTPIPAGGVPFTVLARVEMATPKVASKPALLVAPFSKQQADYKKDEWAKYLKKEKTVTDKYGIKFNLIPPGEFKMGSSKSANELARIFDTKAVYFDDEFPQHKVQITKPYYLGTTEVTQKQWKSIMGTEPWKGKEYVKEGDDYPATYVSWNDIQEFLQKLNRTGKGTYRLPTEAEWEYACRAGCESMYCFGESTETLKSYAWFHKNAWDVDEKYAHRVGLKLPNNFGLYDVHGNVYEWCSDWYDEEYYKESPLANPLGPVGDQRYRAIRGGSWYNDFRITRAPHRNHIPPTGRSSYFGFRLSKTPLARVEIEPSKTVPKPKVMTTRVQPLPVGSKPALLIAPFNKQQADTKRDEWAKYLKKEKTVTNKFGMKFNLIPPGEFKMGRTKSAEELAKIFKTEAKYFDEEFPHKVRISKPYYMGTTEVTQKQWKSVMGTEPWKGQKYVREGDDYPATYISWNDIQEFLRKLNRTGTVTYKLPTEAEWEYACRAGSESMYCFGDSSEALKSYAWIRDNTMDDNEAYAHRVGLKLPNNFGLYDVHGNNWEWCSDWFGEDYYKTSPLTDPKGPRSDQKFRIIRGGSWGFLGRVTRSANRGRQTSSNRLSYIGFRLSRTP